MSVTTSLKAILGELTGNAQLIEEAGLAGLIEEIERTGHIFFAGSGRSGLAIRGFANRLLHLGKSVSMVGDISSPHSRPGDLLIIGSGLIDLGAPRCARSRWEGLAPIGIGLWLLVNTRQLFGMDWRSSWPILLLVIGALVVARGLGLREGRRERRGGGARRAVRGRGAERGSPFRGGPGGCFLF